MQILFPFAKIEVSKGKNLICYVIFFNKDISKTAQDIALKLCMTTRPREVSQIYLFGPNSINII